MLLKTVFSQVRRLMPKTNKTPIERFWSYVDVTPGCWEWNGYRRKPLGHGQFSLNQLSVLAHRVSWEFHNGPIPEGLFVCHKCDVAHCVNPDHLFLGTGKDNMRDCAAKGRNKGNSKITADDALCIRAMYHWSKIGPKEISSEFGCTMSNIWSIILGKSWTKVRVDFSGV